MVKRVKDWLISNNTYRQEFDKHYSDAWKDNSTETCSDEKTPISCHNDYIQFTLMVIGILLVLCGSMFCQIVDQKNVVFTIIVIIGMLLLFVEYLVLIYNLRKTKFFEREMLAVEEAFNKMVPGYKGMGLADKLAQIEVFDLRYRVSPTARLSQFIWILVGVFVQASVVYVGIKGNVINWNDVSMRDLLIWIALVVVLNYLTIYFASEKAYNPGNYKLVTVKYRKWLLNG